MCDWVLGIQREGYREEGKKKGKKEKGGQIVSFQPETVECFFFPAELIRESSLS